MIQFGTDGWRAIIAEDFTFENVRKVAQAYADSLKDTKKRNLKVVVGFDTRFLSPEFAKTVASVLAANNIGVWIFKSALPSPCLCFAIKKYKFSGGIMITASHNPANFNGIKIRTDEASPAALTETKKIEKLFGKSKVREMDYDTALKRGKIIETDYRKEYVKYLRNYINFDVIKKSKFKILHDAMYGTGDHLLCDILAGSNCQVDTIRGELNPSFCGISPEPIAKNLKDSLSIMKSSKYDICLVTDGDADRIGAIAKGGRFLNPGWIMALLLIHFIKNREETGAVVKTISNSSLIGVIARKFKLQVYETPVGFKHIAELMKKIDVLIGGEESGGIGFKNYIPERDGVLSGLLLVELMAHENKGINQIIHEVEDEFGKFYYERVDIHYPDKLKPKLFKKLKSHPFKKVCNFEVVDIKKTDGIKIILANDSWLIFRLSGTEPILRIYSESSSIDKVKKLVSFGKKFALSIK
ncbi:MAG: phosphoglucomutase/phosphomannomutase family protein [Candidatus Saelkia tenebricola]|nr:phosphoglucomutase/phosphomannomutase family protein [Candidatus Saelkia tenebricola]